MTAEWICRWYCHNHPDDMVYTIYEVEISGSDRDYNEWICPRLRVNVESYGKPPEKCPYILEHVMESQNEEA